MTSTTFSQHKADFSLRASEIGALATGALVAFPALRLPVAVGGLAYIIVISAILVMFFNRKQDEFLERHWNAGATTAFFLTCLWGLVAPFTIGIFEGLTGNEQGRNIAEVLAKGILPIGLISFFAAYQMSRLRHR